MLSDNIIKNLGENELKDFEELKTSNGWSVVSKISARVLKELNVADVDEALPANEYKTECEVRKRTKKLILQIFGDVETTNKHIEHKKINYG